MKRRIPVLSLIFAGLAVAATTMLPAQVKPIPVTVDEKPVESEETQVMMQAKLSHAHKVLEGLVTQDFTMIEEAAVALSRISLTPPPDLTKAGDKTNKQVYEHFRM